MGLSKGAHTKLRARSTDKKHYKKGLSSYRSARTKYRHFMWSQAATIEQEPRFGAFATLVEKDNNYFLLKAWKIAFCATE